MRQVILSMKDYIFADAVASALRKDPKSDFAVQTTRSPEEIVQYCRITTPYALLMEVTGYPPYLLSERLKTRQEVKRDAPGCKIVLVVDENSESELAGQEGRPHRPVHLRLHQRGLSRRADGHPVTGGTTKTGPWAGADAESHGENFSFKEESA